MRLFLSNAPLTEIYVYDSASYCTYIAVEKELLPPFRFIGLNSKISPTKVDGEWWNNVCNLQKHPINALVFLKSLCLPMY